MRSAATHARCGRSKRIVYVVMTGSEFVLTFLSEYSGTVAYHIEQLRSTDSGFFPQKSSTCPS